MWREVRRSQFTLVLVVLSLLAGAPQATAQATDQPLGGFDAWIEGVMETWQVPGVAVGVVKDGEVLLAKGYGVRDVEAGLPVTEHTTMAIGSNSKSFTVTLMAMLVDDGMLDWRTPVRDYLPDFQMYDPFATAEMTPRDLVSHQSGLPRHDNLWYGRSNTREEMFHKLRYLEPNASFRSRYQYQNLMFMAAGYLTERLTGESWDEQIRNKIFEPLGMDRSNTSVDDSPGSGDHSLAYALNDGELKRIPFLNIDEVGPAGSINSNAAEMLAYIQMHLSGGEFPGGRLISAEASGEMQRPQFAIGDEDEFPELGHASYGLGLRVSSYRGRKLVAHGGGIDGFISSMSWMPREGIGIVVLSNRSGDSNPVPNIVAYNLYDRLLGLPQVDWNGRNQSLNAKQVVAAQVRAKEAAGARVKGTTPSHPLAGYTGQYWHPGYGIMTVSVADNGLSVKSDGISFEMEHYHYDLFQIVPPENVVPISGLVSFSTGLDGSVLEMAIPFEPNGAPIRFTRRKFHLEPTGAEVG